MENITVSDPEPEPDEEIVALGDATTLTKGSTSESVENKRSPYGG
ncbi:hypothetical protein P3T37_002232 [Kitasatospora sp. MAA4]|nr:albusnodin family lasso peptide [Kitasatospora sp. MAA4]MDH6132846.1 hypothetical protein [Kitasatospora sp. MAA4]